MKFEVTAAPKGASDYTWYVYDSARGTKFTTTNGKRTVTLRSGDTFGLRSGTKNTIRMVTEELGLTIVFTLTEDVKDRLVNKSSVKKKSRAKAKPKTPAKPSKVSVVKQPGKILPVYEGKSYVKGPGRIDCCFISKYKTEPAVSQFAPSGDAIVVWFGTRNIDSFRSELLDYLYEWEEDDDKRTFKYVAFDPGNRGQIDTGTGVVTIGRRSYQLPDSELKKLHKLMK